MANVGNQVLYADQPPSYDPPSYDEVMRIRAENAMSNESPVETVHLMTYIPSYGVNEFMAPTIASAPVVPTSNNEWFQNVYTVVDENSINHRTSSNRIDTVATSTRSLSSWRYIQHKYRIQSMLAMLVFFAIISLTGGYFLWRKKYTSPYCQKNPYNCDEYNIPLDKPNACRSRKCRNGLCVLLGDGYDYKCNCRSGYSGKNCDVDDLCVSQPCDNAGTCHQGFCSCLPKFFGDRCQFDIIGLHLKAKVADNIDDADDKEDASDELILMHKPTGSKKITNRNTNS